MSKDNNNKKLTPIQRKILMGKLLKWLDTDPQYLANLNYIKSIGKEGVK